MSRAASAYAQARLVALQLSVLQQGKQVINLDPRGILKYMEEEPFSEVVIYSWFGLVCSRLRVRYPLIVSTGYFLIWISIKGWILFDLI